MHAVRDHSRTSATYVSHGIIRSTPCVGRSDAIIDRMHETADQSPCPVASVLGRLAGTAELAEDGLAALAEHGHDRVNGEGGRTQAG